MRRRNRNLARSRPAGAPNFPTAVYRPGQIVTRVPKARPKPIPKARTPRPTPAQLRASRVAERGYKSQAGAVRRAAKTQKALGPGKAVRPAGRILRHADIAPHIQEQAYKSLGEAVEKQATRQKAEGKVSYKGKKIDAWRLSTDPKVLKAAGVHKEGLADKLLAAPTEAVGNVPKDALELAVTIPTSAAHMAARQVGAAAESVKKGSVKPLVKAEVQTAKEMIAPYKEAVKHPLDFAVKHPVSTYLMFAPGVKAPLRGAGKVARLTGRQTLVRRTATLPGTAMREVRVRGREVVPTGAELIRRRHQGDRVTVKDIQRRVDEHAEQTRQRAHHYENEAIKQARENTKGRPRAERQQAIDDAAQEARDRAHAESQQAFAREFGANVRPSVSHHEVDLARARSDAAEAAKKQARKERKVAEKAHDVALADARVARARRQHSPRLAALEGELRDAQRALATEQRAAHRAQVGVATAKGQAAVSQAKTKTSAKLQELHGQRRAIATQAVPEEVTGARVAVSQADRRVNTLERAMQREQEKASLLEGRTEGRHAAGRMTAAVGRATANQAERIGHLTDAITDARRVAATAREHLKAAEKAHKGQVREATRGITQQIRSERRRVAGVAPGEHQSLLSAIGHEAESPARVRAAREQVREVDRRLAVERQRISGVPPTEHDALLRAIHQREATREAERGARETHAAAERSRKDLKKSQQQAGLVDAADEGRLYDHRKDATRVAQRLNEQAQQIPVGGKQPFQLHVREPGGEGKPVRATKGTGTQPLAFKVREVGDGQYAVVPKLAAQRLYGGGGAGAQLSHASVGSGKATGAKVMRATRRQFTQATLPLSLKWLAGQVAEAGVRSAVSGAGPMDLLRFNRVVKRMNEAKAGSGDQFAMRILGGHFDPIGAVAEQATGKGKTFAEEFEGTPLKTPAGLATLAGDTAPIRMGRAGWKRYTQTVMGRINHVIENTSRRAMAGQALKQGPLMERHVLGLTDRALDDAARGLQGTEHQVQAARAVDEMYGRYSKWSPEMRSLLLHWTPFMPWYLNSAKFLFHTLPAKHPVKAALLADMNAADEEWRKSKHLSFYGKDRVPDFLLGSYPSKAGGMFRVAHYTPWGVGADPLASAASLTLPQFTGPMLNALGLDWKGKPLTKPGAKKGDKMRPFNLGERAARVAVTAAESQLPAATQVGELTGFTPRKIDKKTDVGTVAERAKKYLPTAATKPPKRKTRKRKPAGFGGGGFGSGGFGSSGL